MDLFKPQNQNAAIQQLSFLSQVSVADVRFDNQLDWKYPCLVA